MNPELAKKSVHDLRVMAQAFGVTDIFEKDAIHLAQEIELKQQNLAPPQIALPPMPQYDARLMTKPPSRKSDADEIVDLLAPYIKIGLKVELSEEGWKMWYGKKTDEGTIRMPLRHVLRCAMQMMR